MPRRTKRCRSKSHSSRNSSVESNYSLPLATRKRKKKLKLPTRAEVASAQRAKYSCFWCDSGFSNDAHFTQHLQLHRDVSIHVCPQCSPVRGFQTEQELQTHACDGESLLVFQQAPSCRQKRTVAKIWHCIGCLACGDIVELIGNSGPDFFGKIGTKVSDVTSSDPHHGLRKVTIFLYNNCVPSSPETGCDHDMSPKTSPAELVPPDAILVSYLSLNTTLSLKCAICDDDFSAYSLDYLVKHLDAAHAGPLSCPKCTRVFDHAWAFARHCANNCMVTTDATRHSRDFLASAIQVDENSAKPDQDLVKSAVQVPCDLCAEEFPGLEFNQHDCAVSYTRRLLIGSTVVKCPAVSPTSLEIKICDEPSAVINPSLMTYFRLDASISVRRDQALCSCYCCEKTPHEPVGEDASADSMEIVELTTTVQEEPNGDTNPSSPPSMKVSGWSLKGPIFVATPPFTVSGGSNDPGNMELCEKSGASVDFSPEFEFPRIEKVESSVDVDPFKDVTITCLDRPDCRADLPSGTFRPIASSDLPPRFPSQTAGILYPNFGESDQVYLVYGSTAEQFVNESKLSKVPEVCIVKPTPKTTTAASIDPIEGVTTCPICQRWLASLDSLKSHLLERHCFPCKLCHACFVSESHLDTHHSKSDCGKMQSFFANLTPDNTHLCKLCSVTFKQVPAYYSHLIQEHPAKVTFHEVTGQVYPVCGLATESRSVAEVTTPRTSSLDSRRQAAAALAIQRRYRSLPNRPINSRAADARISGIVDSVLVKVLGQNSMATRWLSDTRSSGVDYISAGEKTQENVVVTIEDVVERMDTSDGNGDLLCCPGPALICQVRKIYDEGRDMSFDLETFLMEPFQAIAKGVKFEHSTTPAFETQMSAIQLRLMDLNTIWLALKEAAATRKDDVSVPAQSPADSVEALNSASGDSEMQPNVSQRPVGNGGKTNQKVAENSALQGVAKVLHVCPICRASIRPNDNLAHFVGHSKRTYSYCFLCEQAFHTVKQYKTHLETHKVSAKGRPHYLMILESRAGAVWVELMEKSRAEKHIRATLAAQGKLLWKNEICPVYNVPEKPAPPELPSQVSEPDSGRPMAQTRRGRGSTQPRNLDSINMAEVESYSINGASKLPIPRIPPPHAPALSEVDVLQNRSAADEATRPEFLPPNVTKLPLVNIIVGTVVNSLPSEQQVNENEDSDLEVVEEIEKPTGGFKAPAAIPPSRLGQAKQVCSICQKSFLTKKSLNEHMTSHDQDAGSTVSNVYATPLNKMLWICRICSIAFPQQYTFQKHVSAHNRYVSCKLCSSICFTKEQVEQHAQGHDKLGFGCTICSKALKSEANLHLHLNIVHDLDLLWLCKLCSLAHSSRATLTSHIARSHSKEVEQNSTYFRTLQDGRERFNKSVECELGVCVSKKIHYQPSEEERALPPPAAGVVADCVHRTFMAYDEFLVACKECGTLIPASKYLLENPLLGRLGSLRFQMVDDSELHGQLDQFKAKGKSTSSGSMMKREFDTHSLQPANPVVGVDIASQPAVTSTRQSTTPTLKGVAQRPNTTCNVCQMRCETTASLKVHHLKHESSMRYFCLECGLKFHQIPEFSAHIYQRHGSKLLADLECPICCRKISEVTPKDGSILVSLRYHLSKAHQGFACKHCSFVCQSFPKLNAHVSQHAAMSTTHGCQLCGVVLGKAELAAHEYKHVAEPWFMCRECGLCFKNETQFHEDFLHKHATGRLEQNYGCALCKLGQFDGRALVTHVQEHHLVMAAKLLTKLRFGVEFASNSGFKMLSITDAPTSADINNVPPKLLAQKLTSSAQPSQQQLYSLDQNHQYSPLPPVLSPQVGVSIGESPCSLSEQTFEPGFIWVCQFCRLVLPTHKAVRAHSSMHMLPAFWSLISMGHGQGPDHPLRCATCSLDVRQSQMIDHLMQSHAFVGHFPCPKCQEHFHYRFDRNYHVQFNHLMTDAGADPNADLLLKAICAEDQPLLELGGPLMCVFCSLPLSNSTCLAMHVQSMHGPGAGKQGIMNSIGLRCYFCLLCGLVFRDTEVLFAHIRNHGIGQETGGSMGPHLFMTLAVGKNGLMCCSGPWAQGLETISGHLVYKHYFSMHAAFTHLWQYHQQAQGIRHDKDLCRICKFMSAV